MDAFYASVEALDDPSLSGKPVIVGGSRQRGVVSAASYEARKFGIHSAMPMARAVKLCPTGIFLPPRMTRYQEVSARIFSIFRNFTPLVEPLSLDEAFLDVTGSIRLFGPTAEIAARIRKQVQTLTGLTVSAGLASSKLVAKIASDFKKPDGLTIVPAGHEQEFLAPLPVSRLWGVGQTTLKDLALLGVDTIGDLRDLSYDLLKRKFKKHGSHLYYACRGIDEREVTPDREIKSVGHEETFADDITDIGVIRLKLLALADKVAGRLRRSGLGGRTVTIKVKFYDFRQITRSMTIPAPTNDSRGIHKTSLLLLKKTAAGKIPIRLLGISLSQLREDKAVQTSLFSDKNDQFKRRLLNRAVDEINAKFGSTTMLPGSLLR